MTQQTKTLMTGTVLIIFALIAGLNIGLHYQTSGANPHTQVKTVVVHDKPKPKPKPTHKFAIGQNVWDEICGWGCAQNPGTINGYGHDDSYIVAYKSTYGNVRYDTTYDKYLSSRATGDTYK